MYVPPAQAVQWPSHRPASPSPARPAGLTLARGPSAGRDQGPPRTATRSMSLSSADSPRATEPNSHTSHTPAPANASPARQAASTDGTAPTSASVTATTATLPASCRLRFACRRQGGGQILEHQAPVRVMSPARDAGGPPTSAWVSVTVTVVTPALEADAPISLRLQAPACERTRQRRRGRNARPCRQPEPTRADAQTGDAALAGPGATPAVGSPAPARGVLRGFLDAEAHQLTNRRRPLAAAHRPPGRAVDAAQPVQPTPDKDPPDPQGQHPPAPCATPQPADPLPGSSRSCAESTSQAASRQPQVPVLEPSASTTRRPHPAIAPTASPDGTSAQVAPRSHPLNQQPPPSRGQSYMSVCHQASCTRRQQHHQHSHRPECHCSHRYSTNKPTRVYH